MANEYTESQKKASLKYQAGKAQIKITVDKEKRDLYQKAASERGVSMTKLIIEYLDSLCE